MAENLLDRQERLNYEMQLPKLCTLDYKQLDWFSAGDAFFVISSLMFMAIPFTRAFVDVSHWSEYSSHNFYTLTNVIMFLDATFYQIGYFQYIFQIRSILVTGSIGIN